MIVVTQNRRDSRDQIINQTITVYKAVWCVLIHSRPCVRSRLAVFNIRCRMEQKLDDLLTELRQTCCEMEKLSTSIAKRLHASKKGQHKIFHIS